MRATSEQSGFPRWFRFRLRTLLISVSVLGVVLGLIGNEAIRLRRHRQSEARIRALGGKYWGRCEQPLRDPWGPWWFPIVRSGMYADVEEVRFCSTANAGLQDSDLLALQSLPNVQVVEIVAAGITDKGLEHLAQLRNLRRLLLAETQVTSAGLQQLRHCPIEQLVLNGNRITDETLHCLDAFPKLKKLALYETSVSDEGLANLRCLKLLEHLYLNKCPITDQGMRHVADATGLTCLELFHLDVGDTGIKELERLRKLASLDIEHLNVTDEGIVSIARLPWVSHLWVFDTRVTKAGLLKFEKSGILRSLVVGPDFSAEAIEELQELLPACKVYNSNELIRFHGP